MTLELRREVLLNNFNSWTSLEACLKTYIGPSGRLTELLNSFKGSTAERTIELACYFESFGSW